MDNNIFTQAISETRQVIELSDQELNDIILEAIIDEQSNVYHDCSRVTVSAHGVFKAIVSLCKGGKAIRVNGR
jgi:hypothetical protein